MFVFINWSAISVQCASFCLSWHTFTLNVCLILHLLPYLQVCNFVFQRHPSLGPVDGLSSSLPDGVATGSGSDGNYSMDHLLPILKRYSILFSIRLF